MRKRRSPRLTFCPSTNVRSSMKPLIRATTSTLSIAVTRPMKVTVSVICRLTTGTTETEGGGAVCATAPPQTQETKTNAKTVRTGARRPDMAQHNPPGIETLALLDRSRQYLLETPGFARCAPRPPGPRSSAAQGSCPNWIAQPNTMLCLVSFVL